MSPTVSATARTPPDPARFCLACSISIHAPSLGHTGWTGKVPSLRHVKGVRPLGRMSPNSRQHMETSLAGHGCHLWWTFSRGRPIRTASSAGARLVGDVDRAREAAHSPRGGTVPASARLLCRRTDSDRRKGSLTARHDARDRGRSRRGARRRAEAIDASYSGGKAPHAGPTAPSELRDKFRDVFRQPISVCRRCSGASTSLIPSWKILPALVCSNDRVQARGGSAAVGRELRQALADAGVPAVC